MKVYIVDKEYDGIEDDIHYSVEKVFLSKEKAHEFVNEHNSVNKWHKCSVVEHETEE